MRVRRHGGLQSSQCWCRVAFPLEAIAEALKSNSTLTTIQLAFNSIGVEGGKARWCQGSASSSRRGLAVSLRGACRGSEEQHNSLRNWPLQKQHPQRVQAGLGGSQGSSAVSEALSSRGPQESYRGKARRGPGERGTFEGALARRLPSCTTRPTEVELMIMIDS